MESCIKQNNAIEIYQDYFNEIDEATDCEEPKAKVLSIIFSERKIFLYLLDRQSVPRSRLNGGSHQTCQQYRLEP